MAERGSAKPREQPRTAQLVPFPCGSPESRLPPLLMAQTKWRGSSVLEEGIFLSCGLKQHKYLMILEVGGPEWVSWGKIKQGHVPSEGSR